METQNVALSDDGTDKVLKFRTISEPLNETHYFLLVLVLIITHF